MLLLVFVFSVHLLIIVGIASWLSPQDPEVALPWLVFLLGDLLCHHRCPQMLEAFHHLCFLLSFSHFFLGMTEFLILSATSFDHSVTICKLLGEKCCHDKESLLPASTGSTHSRLYGHLCPGGSAAAVPFLHQEGC